MGSITTSRGLSASPGGGRSRASTEGVQPNGDTSLVTLDTAEQGYKNLAHRELARRRDVQKTQPLDEQVDAVGLERLFCERVPRAELARQIFDRTADSRQGDSMLVTDR
jgi:hypothetical protein